MDVACGAASRVTRVGPQGTPPSAAAALMSMIGQTPACGPLHWLFLGLNSLPPEVLRAMWLSSGTFKVNET